MSANAKSTLQPEVQMTAKELWFCREFWNGDSKDGQFTNGDGYHYYLMKRGGIIAEAFEYYETDDGEEHVIALPELVGINWFEYFGFDDDELLEEVTEQEFIAVKEIRSHPQAD